jgi:PAB-dependent poly(A)-specific ribonuclease subunit 2
MYDVLSTLQVPPEQIIDTVKLFHLPKQRYISLKFLAWYFLNVIVQKESHDSCEDARTALLLYRKYQELEAQGKVEEVLHKVYDTGRSYNWKTPES